MSEVIESLDGPAEVPRAIGIAFAPPQAWRTKHFDPCYRENARGRVYPDGAIYIEWVFYWCGSRNHPRFAGILRQDGSYVGFAADGVGYGWRNDEKHMLELARGGHAPSEMLLETPAGWRIDIL